MQIIFGRTTRVRIICRNYGVYNKVAGQSFRLVASYYLLNLSLRVFFNENPVYLGLQIRVVKIT